MKLIKMKIYQIAARSGPSTDCSEGTKIQLNQPNLNRIIEDFVDNFDEIKNYRCYNDQDVIIYGKNGTPMVLIHEDKYKAMKHKIRSDELKAAQVDFSLVADRNILAANLTKYQSQFKIAERKSKSYEKLCVKLKSLNDRAELQIIDLRRKLKSELDELKSFQEKIRKLYSEAQIDKMLDKDMKVMWLCDDILKADKLLQMVTPEAYNYVRCDLKFPLPTINIIEDWKREWNIHLQRAWSNDDMKKVISLHEMVTPKAFNYKRCQLKCPLPTITLERRNIENNINPTEQFEDASELENLQGSDDIETQQALEMIIDHPSTENTVDGQHVVKRPANCDDLDGNNVNEEYVLTENYDNIEYCIQYSNNEHSNTNTDDNNHFIIRNDDTNNEQNHQCDNSNIEDDNIQYIEEDKQVQSNQHVEKLNYVEERCNDKSIQCIEGGNESQSIQYVESVNYAELGNEDQNNRYVEGGNQNQSIQYVESVDYVEGGNEDQSIQYVESVNYVEDGNEDQSIQYVESVNYVESSNQDRSIQYVESVNYVEDGNENQSIQYVESVNYVEDGNENQSIQYVESVNYVESDNEDQGIQYVECVNNVIESYFEQSNQYVEGGNGDQINQYVEKVNYVEGGNEDQSNQYVESVNYVKGGNEDQINQYVESVNYVEGGNENQSNQYVQSVHYVEGGNEDQINQYVENVNYAEGGNEDQSNQYVESVNYVESGNEDQINQYVEGGNDEQNHENVDAENDVEGSHNAQNHANSDTKSLKWELNKIHKYKRIKPDWSEIRKMNRLTCGLCKRPFESEEELKEHVSQHYLNTSYTTYLDAQKPFQCQFCNQELSQRVTLIRHHIIHLGIDSVRCWKPGCNYVGSMLSVEAHEETHLARTHCCPQCPAKFKTRLVLLQHFERRHSADRSVRRCQVCRATCRSEFTFHLHMLSHNKPPRHLKQHDTYNLALRSRYRRTFYPSSNEYYQYYHHIKSDPHSKVMGYPCFCNQSFITKNLLLRHQEECIFATNENGINRRENSLVPKSVNIGIPDLIRPKKIIEENIKTLEAFYQEPAIPIAVIEEVVPVPAYEEKAIKLAISEQKVIVESQETDTRLQEVKTKSQEIYKQKNELGSIPFTVPEKTYKRKLVSINQTNDQQKEIFPPIEENVTSLPLRNNKINIISIQNVTAIPERTLPQAAVPEKNHQEKIVTIPKESILLKLLSEKSDKIIAVSPANKNKRIIIVPVDNSTKTKVAEQNNYPITKSNTSVNNPMATDINSTQLDMPLIE